MYKMLNLDNIVSTKKKSSSENDDWSFRMLITKDPYSFMMVDTRPTARVTFKKNFDKPLMSGDIYK